MSIADYPAIILNMSEMNISQIFAENLAVFRKKKGLSQYDLAQLSGISRRMIGHYEIEGIIPPGNRLQALAAALDIPVSKLFEPHTAAEMQTRKITVDFTDIDPRSVKKFRDILSLPTEDRNDLYRILNKMLRKNQLEHQQAASNP